MKVNKRRIFTEKHYEELFFTHFYNVFDLLPLRRGMFQDPFFLSLLNDWEVFFKANIHYQSARLIVCYEAEPQIELET